MARSMALPLQLVRIFQISQIPGLLRQTCFFRPQLFCCLQLPPLERLHFREGPDHSCIRQYHSNTCVTGFQRCRQDFYYEIRSGLDGSNFRRCSDAEQHGGNPQQFRSQCPKGPNQYYAFDRKRNPQYQQSQQRFGKPEQQFIITQQRLGEPKQQFIITQQRFGEPKQQLQQPVEQ